MAELQKLGTWVTNAMPLSDDKMRFEVLNDQRETVLAKLASWDWHPRPCDMGARFIPSGNGAVLQPTTLYELLAAREEAPKPHGAEVINPEEWRKMLADFKVKKGKQQWVVRFQRVLARRLNNLISGISYRRRFLRLSMLISKTTASLSSNN